MNKLITWLTTSNRHLHLLGGVLVGLFADGLYCAATLLSSPLRHWNLRISVGAVGGTG